MGAFSQFSFSGGEVAPALYARVDTAKYAFGLRTLNNAYVKKHGGINNRPGTRFVCEVNDSSKNVRLMPFVFNSDQTFCLELGDLYLRIIEDGAQVTESAKTITGITKANPAVVTTSGAHGYTTGDEVYISGVVGMTEVNGWNFKIIVLSGTTFSLKYMSGSAVNSSSFTTYSSGGTAERIYTLVTPWTENELPDLRFVQSADVITVAHPNHNLYEISRSGAVSWSVDAVTFEPGIAQPSFNSSGAFGFVYAHGITAVSDTGEESLISPLANINAVPTSGAPITLSSITGTGAAYYNIYGGPANGSFGFLGVSSGGTFVDNGIVPDVSIQPPATFNFDSEPAAVAYVQQRLVIGGADATPETVQASRTGYFKNFTRSNPLTDDSALSFRIIGRIVSRIMHILEMGKPVVFTSGSEVALLGNDAEILTPTSVNPRAYTYYGCSRLAPIVIDSDAIYVQAGGSIIRTLGFDIQADGYRGNDLTVFSSHLFEGYTLTDWTYQKNNDSIVWACRGDQYLLGLTYIREHQMLAWHKHNFGSDILNVLSIPEGTEDGTYVVVKRSINGRTVRYIERMASRLVDDIRDAVFMDCSLAYDGRNAGSRTMTVSGGTDWDYEEELTLTASSSYFTASEIGNCIFLGEADGDFVKLDITAYTSATVVTVRPRTTVPTSLRTATTNWSRAVDTLAGLQHLEGVSVSILGDGYVLASPRNPVSTYPTYTVTSGSITLDDCYAVIQVGVPYTTEIETLDINTPDGNGTGVRKNIQKVTLMVQDSRGIMVGGPTADSTGFQEIQIREDEDYQSPIALRTGDVDVVIDAFWNSNGRIRIRQYDPLPMTILSIKPEGFIGGN